MKKKYFPENFIFRKLYYSSLTEGNLQFSFMRPKPLNSKRDTEHF